LSAWPLIEETARTRKGIARSILLAYPRAGKISFRQPGVPFSKFRCTIFSINTIIHEPGWFASARLSGTTGHSSSTKGRIRENKSRIKYPNTLLGLFSAYLVGRKGDRYGHYNLRLGRHAPRAHRPRPQASRPAGSRTSSVGSVDDQAIAAGADISLMKLGGKGDQSPV
jgi:hypothetical protein